MVRRVEYPEFEVGKKGKREGKGVATLKTRKVVNELKEESDFEVEEEERPRKKAKKTKSTVKLKAKTTSDKPRV